MAFSAAASTGDNDSAGDGDYTSGDGTTQFYAAENRGDPIVFEGIGTTSPG